MHNKRNIIVMFLFIMLSFAIISEVSAVSDAEISGTGFDPSLKTNICHDIASERDNGFMQNHGNNGDFNSHDEQKSFTQSPRVNGDKNSNENLYEHNGEKSNRNRSLDSNNVIDFNKQNEFKCNDFVNNQRFDGNNLPLDNKTMNKHVGNFSGIKPMDNFTGAKNIDLRDNNVTAAHKNGEAWDDIMSKLMGLDRIAPNIKDDKILSNNSKSNDNRLLAPKFDNSTQNCPIVFNNEVNNSKVNQKPINTKINEKSVSKKIYSLRIVKKVNRHLLKNIRKEGAKL